MVFGKPGRPPEDRLARQHEIYTAVIPLLERDGARRLSMQDAAHAACLSIGGLYHNFPTKQALVLHGLETEARERVCREYWRRATGLAPWDFEGYLEAYLDHAVVMAAFIRPAAQAALELGVATWQTRLDYGLATHVTELERALSVLTPGLPGEESERLGRALCRVLLGTVVDRQADFGEMRAELRSLFLGVVGAKAVQGATRDDEPDFGQRSDPARCPAQLRYRRFHKQT